MVCVAHYYMMVYYMVKQLSATQYVNCLYPLKCY